ncbi:hypothetical protein B0H19DRAFT_1058474 [Mycena capillaripes]|nr:hypothetical protein B0H19DRAFT_1058474 [Mycena capillaripes]
MVSVSNRKISVITLTLLEKSVNLMIAATPRSNFRVGSISSGFNSNVLSVLPSNEDTRQRKVDFEFDKDRSCDERRPRCPRVRGQKTGADAERHACVLEDKMDAGRQDQRTRWRRHSAVSTRAVCWAWLTVEVVRAGAERGAELEPNVFSATHTF